MRIELALDAVADVAYDRSYFHKVRGRIWCGLGDDDTSSETHDPNHGVGFSYFNIFPWGQIEEDDRRYLRIASPRRGLLDILIAHFGRERALEIGQMRFTIDDITGYAPDVGEAGSTGVLGTGTGAHCALGRQLAEGCNLDTPKTDVGESETELFWRPKHGMEPLQDAIRRSLQQTYELYGDDYYGSPGKVDEPLFSHIKPIKDGVVYPVRFQPAAAVGRTVLLLKWRLGYYVRDETHRYHLNLALDSGTGQRREYGFGFLNLTDRIPPRASD